MLQHARQAFGFSIALEEDGSWTPAATSLSFLRTEAYNPVLLGSAVTSAQQQGEACQLAQPLLRHRRVARHSLPTILLSLPVFRSLHLLWGGRGLLASASSMLCSFLLPLNFL